MEKGYRALLDWFTAHPRCAVAYSGGADSTLLIKAAADAGTDARAYCVRSAFQPAWETRDAGRFAAQIGLPLSILALDILSNPDVAANGAQRCYDCKRAIFGRILEAAARDGYTLLADGTNASDETDDRPGMRALTELSVLSPLRLCGLTKPEVRRLSRALGLPSADKPAYACLATRIPTGTRIDASALMRVEKSEDLLFEQGFSDFRVRLRGGGALLELRAEDQTRYLARQDALDPLLKQWFSSVDMAPESRKGD